LAEKPSLLESFRAAFAPRGEKYWLTRTFFLRLGFIYLLGFFSLTQQLVPLIGENGLLPAAQYLERIAGVRPTAAAQFFTAPTIFWLGCSDGAMLAVCWIGVVLSLLVMGGIANAGVMALLWVFYSSMVHVGQLFYGYGWEMMLLEAGFLAIFLCPLRDWRPFPKKDAPPVVVMWLLRWMMFRVMFGAGMIKMRGDPCWKDLTCLLYHYETQPIPHPLSWYFHHLPPILNKAGVLFNHFVEIVVPWFMFSPRRWRLAAGILFAIFQISLILSGNLSWLNWLTLVLCISFFDDAALRTILPKNLYGRIPEKVPETKKWTPRKKGLLILTAVVVVLSINPVLNMLSSRQAMNRSFDPFNIVNTYGAFGAVGKRRTEVVLEGTRAPAPGPAAEWREYEFICKPGDVSRAPCVRTPYHHRIDWQIWFAAMSDYRRNPWLVHFVYKLLQSDAGALSLIAGNPFPEGRPTFVRAWLYEYKFTDPGDPSGDWWKRKKLRPYLPPLSLKNPGLKQFIAAYGWRTAAAPNPTPG